MAKNEYWKNPPTIKKEFDGGITASYWADVDKFWIQNRFMKTVTMPGETILLIKDELLKFIEEVEEKRQ